ncbi:MAG: hypothetical protein QOF98_1198, partial [Streptomyces sp.]|nr:hypothetical protein [Streptomyces sp.]
SSRPFRSVALGRRRRGEHGEIPHRPVAGRAPIRATGGGTEDSYRSAAIGRRGSAPGSAGEPAMNPHWATRGQLPSESRRRRAAPQADRESATNSPSPDLVARQGRAANGGEFYGDGEPANPHRPVLAGALGERPRSRRAPQVYGAPRRIRARRTRPGVWGEPPMAGSPAGGGADNDSARISPVGRLPRAAECGEHCGGAGADSDSARISPAGPLPRVADRGKSGRGRGPTTIPHGSALPGVCGEPPMAGSPAGGRRADD